VTISGYCAEISVLSSGSASRSNRSVAWKHQWENYLNLKSMQVELGVTLAMLWGGSGLLWPCGDSNLDRNFTPNPIPTSTIMVTVYLRHLVLLGPYETYFILLKINSNSNIFSWQRFCNIYSTPRQKPRAVWSASLGNCIRIWCESRNLAVAYVPK
jgi:hypothetical protein